MEHKSRGKRIDNGEWAYGQLVELDGESFILIDGCDFRIEGFVAFSRLELDAYQVHSDSVGMCTGLASDVTHHSQGFGVEVYGFDVFKIHDESYTVQWLKKMGCFCLWPENNSTLPPVFGVDFANIIKTHEVIGNTTDNPGLLEVK